MSILLIDSNNIELYNIMWAPKYDLNLISCGQLEMIRMTYYDDFVTITLMK